MTINQKRRIKNNKSLKQIKALREDKLIVGPQKKGIIVKLYTMTPKKPNSAIRKVARVQFTYSNPKSPGFGRVTRSVVAYIPGEKHKLTLHNLVLVRPGKTQDLPGIKYKIIKGALDHK